MTGYITHTTHMRGRLKKRFFAFFLAALTVFFVSFSLSSCGTGFGFSEDIEDTEDLEDSEGSEDSEDSFDALSSLSYSNSVDWGRFRGQNVTINVYNWGEYISVDDGVDSFFDTVKEFEELTGINVEYTTFSTNEEMYAKMKSGGTSYDIVIPSDYMISRMINEGMLEKLDFSNIPNFGYIREDLKNPEYDAKNEYSVPYMWGVVGIIYNTTLVDPEDDVFSWDILWNEKYEGNIFMFSNSRDTFGIALKHLGYSYNTTDEKQIRNAAAALTEQKRLVQAYIMDEIFDKMGGGEAALAPYYAGDALVMMEDNPDLAFAVPREGTNLYVDAMCVPKGSVNKEAAEMFINFMCETKTALANCEYVMYSTPHTEAFGYLDEEIQNSVSYPSNEVLEKAEAYVSLPDETTKLVDGLWTDLMSSGSVSPYAVPVFIAVCLALSVSINVVKNRKKKREKGII